MDIGGKDRYIALMSDAPHKSKRLRDFTSGVRRGLASPVELYQERRYPLPHTGERSMRSDWERIGQDFRNAAGAAHGQTSPKTRAA